MAHWKADDDSLIYFEVHGDGPNKETMLLLPGLLGAVSSQWNNFIPLLTPHYRIVIPDLRGHGRSENRESKLMPERMVADLHGLLDHLQITAVHIAGYSLGGYLGLMLHLKDPRRVQTLVMHATKFYWTKEALAAMRQQLDPDAMAAKVPAYANQLAQEHGGSHWRVLVRQASDLVGYLSTSGVTETMAARAQCPILVSVGDRDEMVPLPEALRLSRVFPHGELLTLPGVRHPFSAIREMPFVPMLREFPRTAVTRRR
jgi:pimeloyl-ACP methyl ester carboxylesterase